MERDSIRLASNAVGSLFLSKGAREGTRLQQAFVEQSKRELYPPSVSEISVLADIAELVLNARKSAKDLKSPYWLEGEKHDPLEVFSTSIQFLDDHNGPLPKTSLPPCADVSRYSEFVLSAKEPLSIKSQTQELMDIAGQNIVGAANLGMVTSRLFARGSDTRAYPEIDITPEIIGLWNQNLSQFEVADGRYPDAAGDTYYFWTLAYSTLALRINNSPIARVLDKTFDHGQEIMYFVRSKIVGRPPVQPHTESSLMGRNVGIALAALVKSEVETINHS